jgi:DNA-binding winged helix-turn-helix (wHTH) protein
MRYGFEDYVLDTERRELCRGATVVPVEPQVFDLLAYLIENRERVVTRDDLRVSVWQGRIVSESTLGSSINAVRTAIGDSGDAQRLVRTLQRKGFRFVGPVREEAANAQLTEQVAAPIPLRAEETPSPRAARPSGRTRFTVFAMVTAAVAGVAATLMFLWWPRNASRPPAPDARFDATVVPLVDDAARRLLAGYLSRPDHKALAITGEGWAVSDGETTAEAARQDALRRCNAKTKRQCRIYAVDGAVVWSKEAMPLPAPQDLHLEPLDEPLVPDEVPTLSRERQLTIAKVHMKAPNHRALALTTGGQWTIAGRDSRAEAVRLALERCGEFWQRPCMVISIDGLLTIRIPKSQQLSRVFLPSTEAEIPSDERARIARVYQGAEWRAVAKGRNGSWHVIAAAASEVDAINAVLKSCAGADNDCRLYAIGNFRVAGE